MIAGYQSAGYGAGHIPNDRPGQKFTKFKIQIPYEDKLSGAIKQGQFTFASPICYELADPQIVRNLCFYDSQDIDFIVNLSNDNFYKKSAELDQMLDIAKMRCIENRKPMGRCTTTGISAFISATGEVDNFIKDKDGETKEVQGILTGNIKIHKGQSVYNKVGDWFGWLCFIVFVLSAVFWIYRQED